MTREAMELYRDKLRPDGLLMLHVSNRHYELAQAVSATARAIGYEAANLSYQPGPARSEELAADASEWVIVGTPADIDRLLPLGWSVRPDGPVLSDDFSDVVRLLR
jgi:hypothetical protein